MGSRGEWKTRGATSATQTGIRNSRNMAMATLVWSTAKKKSSSVSDDIAAMTTRRQAAPGRRQSASIGRRRKTTPRTRAAKAMRSMRMIASGASAHATSGALPAMPRYETRTMP